MKHTRPGQRTWRVRGTGVLAIAFALLGGALLPASGASQDAPQGTFTPSTAGPGGGTDEVTLITGDVVQWTVANGHRSALVKENPDGGAFQTIESGDDYYVIPSEVSSLLDTRLDRELFNVAGLVAQGYTDKATNGTPVILEGDSTSSTPVKDWAPGLAVKRSLPDLKAVAGTIKHDKAKAFGHVLSQAAVAESKRHKASKGSKRSAVPGAGTFSVPELAGVEKVWLDARVTADLEESVPQTGAPTAWNAGYDGTGMTIAVLDTGIDQNHPDVASKIAESRNFTKDPSVQDGHGHGTHVASIAAGTGAASAGLRKGMAPGANLAIGKVLDASGDGYTSDIMAGMEWAASLPDVDVINMSLGGEVTDGTDPLSQAVNTLTAEHGVLFVTSAGNDGPRAGTVSTPGTADAALTVGAVDKSHRLASFSSRGPRMGDGAITPQITAPGVGIKAARAAGTSMGTPVNDFYTSTNGTSIASPHVAGAVALLKQEHPDWDPATLKAALINSATPAPSRTVFEQGGGELNLARAIDATVVTSPAALSMGIFTFPHAGAAPTTKKLTYTNHGDQAMTAGLRVDLVDLKGAAAPAGMVTVQPSAVSLAPGASAEVEVTLDRTFGTDTTYSGSVVASDATGKRLAGTPIGFIKQPEQYELTIDGIQRDGKPAGDASTVAVLDAVTMANFGKSSVPFVDGVATLTVPPGTYSVMGMITTLGAGSEVHPDSQALLGDPEITIAKDTHLTFDARQAKQIKVTTPHKGASIQGHAMQYHRTSASSGGFTQTWAGGDWPYYVGETEPVSGGVFNFGSKFEMSAPGVWMDLAFPELGRIPANPSYVVTDDTTATVTSNYHSDVTPERVGRAVPARFPWEGSAFAEYRYLDAPTQRLERFSANETRFFQAVFQHDGAALYETETGYQPKQHLEQSWFKSARTPKLEEGNSYTQSKYPTTRLGDTLDLNVYPFGDANPLPQTHSGSNDWYSDSDTTAFRIYQNGQLYATGEAGFGTVKVAPKSRLRFEYDVARDATWWTTSTRTRTAWEIDGSTTTSKQHLPLLQVDYDLKLDLTNQAVEPKDSKGPFTIGLTVRQPYGVQSTKVTDAQAWLSYDDGKTWQARPTKAQGDGAYQVMADHRDGGGFASIKVRAKDANGNLVEQEVIRAYKIRP